MDSTTEGLPTTIQPLIEVFLNGQSTNISEPNIGTTGHHFVFADYLVFGFMLGVSTFIGVYFAFKDKLVSKAENFFTAEGKLGVIPVGLSMLASFLSSITIIGQPAEAFLYGSQLGYFGCSCFIVIPIVGYYFAPFFQQKKYMSAYHYFGDRFSKKLQVLASILFTLQMVLYLALVLYAPALAFHKVTNVNTFMIVSVLFSVCIFYTTIGGVKAVVWTDSFQVVILYISLFVILIKGTINIGGLTVVWETNAAYNRTDFFEWSMDPTIRYSTWSSLIGSAILHIAFYGGNQVKIQRYLTVRTPAQARKILWINTIGWSIVVLLTVYAGLLIFAHYANCNPFVSKKVTIADELFPLYVMETFHDMPGFPGLFLAGVFSAGLSTVSAGVNSLAALWMSELREWTKMEEIWERKSAMIAKLISLIFGILSFLCVFLVPHLGGLTPVAISLSGIFTGSLFGIFCLGMFFKRATNVGAMTGLISSISILVWLAIGSVITQPSPINTYAKLNISTENCNAGISSNKISHLTLNVGATELHQSIYKISFLWYPALACFFTVVIGLVVSLISEFCNKTRKIDSNKYQHELLKIHSEQQPLESSSMVTDSFLKNCSHIS